jgi:small-conductance mechanosensitive channel
VVLGIAGQQSLSGVFAGLVLLLTRPVDLGDRVWIRSGPMGGELRGTVTEISLLYVRLDTTDGGQPAEPAGVGRRGRPGGRRSRFP